MKIEEKSDPNFFFGVVCTHFDAYRAGIQKIKKNLYWGPMGQFPPGDLAIFRLSDFQRPGAQNVEKIDQNRPKSKNFRIFRSGPSVKIWVSEV